MKTIRFSIVMIMLLVMSSPVIAGDVYRQTLFNDYTGLASTARYSPPFNYGVFTKKTVVVGGKHASGAFLPYSGTYTLVGAPTGTGPWVTVKDKAGNAVTATGNAVFDIDSALPFLRAVWTRTKHRVTSYIYYSE